jgi:small ligand-binding sensory domain FIST
LKFASAVSRLVEGVDAAEELLHAIRAGGCPNPDFVALFITGHHRESAALIADHIRIQLEPGTLIGCTGEGVIGADREIEREPGAAALAASLPGVTVGGFHISPQDWNDALASAEVLETLLGNPEGGRGCLILADPFSTPIDELLAALDRQPGIGPVFGGMASGAYQPGGNALFLNDELYTEGCVGAVFTGPIRVQTIVSQGCRPIGERYLVTGAVQNLITTLGNRPALEVAREAMEMIRDYERSVGSELFLGIAMSEYQEEFGRGDFLVRNLIGGDPGTGVIAVGDAIRPGQTVQFHVRDAQAADDDLRALLSPAADSAPSGALLFSCNGRGTRLFEEPCHDIGATLDVLPGLQAAGFFAMGELGPVGGKSYIHGHSASIALFSPAKEAQI